VLRGLLRPFKEEKMGQYLGIGIAFEMNVKKSEIKKAGLNVKSLQEKMKKELLYEPELYNVSDIDNKRYYKITLKEEILQAELLPLLQELYPVIYNHDKSWGYKKVLEALSGKNAAEWLEIAENANFYEFQMDGYAEPEYITNFPDEICIHHSNIIMLSMEGKILMESYISLFRFFKYTIAKSFSEFSLARAIRVYLAG
jgi:hypothetical protein